MVDLIFVFDLLEGKKLRNGSQMTFVETGAEFSFNNLKTLELENLMQAMRRRY